MWTGCSIMHPSWGQANKVCWRGLDCIPPIAMQSGQCQAPAEARVWRPGSQPSPSSQALSTTRTRGGQRSHFVFLEPRLISFAKQTLYAPSELFSLSPCSLSGVPSSLLSFLMEMGNLFPLAPLGRTLNANAAPSRSTQIDHVSLAGSCHPSHGSASAAPYTGRDTRALFPCMIFWPPNATSYNCLEGCRNI